MSTRNVRKLAKKLQLASQQDIPDKDKSDQAEGEHFEPLYTSHAHGNHQPAYAGLVASISSTEEEESSSEKSITIDEAAVPVHKKNKNRKKKSKCARPGPSRTTDESLSSPVDNERDEVAKLVAEVNEMLGVPSLPEPEPEPAAESSLKLLMIDHKHLNVNNELTRLFGPEEHEGRRPRPKPRTNVRPMRRQIIMTNDTYEFAIRGLSMNLVELRDGIKSFRFEHSPQYQKHMRKLVAAMKRHYSSFMRSQDYEVYSSSTVEAFIENVDLYFSLDEATLGTETLEQAIYFMQNVFDPAFNYIDGKTRLEYKYVENRAFHIALLKYLHILTNKACHRTALELAKLLLNLDPSDPLGVIFIMDTLALRAREHQWLVDIYNHKWAHERDATRLFHVRYSHALAMYHIYLKTKKIDDLRESNRLLKYALTKYPNVAVMIMNLCKHENAEIMTHEMFTTVVNSTTSSDLLSLQMLYAKFVWPKWRELQIMDWVTTNALEIISMYKDDPGMKADVKKEAEERMQLFRKFPLEIKRHLNTISSMSNLLVEGAVPAVVQSVGFNPYPDKGECVDIHRYYKDWGVNDPEGPAQVPGLMESFIASVRPPNTGNPPENRGG